MMPDFILFALAILKASLITGLLPGVAVTLYMERKREPKALVIEFPRVAPSRNALRKVL